MKIRKKIVAISLKKPIHQNFMKNVRLLNKSLFFCKYSHADSKFPPSLVKYRFNCRLSISIVGAGKKRAQERPARPLFPRFPGEIRKMRIPERRKISHFQYRLFHSLYNARMREAFGQTAVSFHLSNSPAQSIAAALAGVERESLVLIGRNCWH